MRQRLFLQNWGLKASRALSRIRASSGRETVACAPLDAGNGTSERLFMKRLSMIVAGIALAANWASSAETKVDFTKQIQPILQQNCIKCHGPDKQKGKLRLDSKEAAFKGGKDGVILTAGNADKSEIYRRITLPKGDDDIMPSEGDPLTKAQTDLIRDWITQGAVWSETVPAKAGAAIPGPTLPADFKPA